jgi:hypothetical protein
MTLRNCEIWGAAGVLALAIMVAPASAQENLDQGKTAAQLFASDCAICHKSPNGLGKAGGLFGLDSFLRLHYTASRESAAVLAKYLQAYANAPEPGTKKTKRSAKSPDKEKSNKKPAEAKSSNEKLGKDKDAKPAEAKTEPKAEPKKEIKDSARAAPKAESKAEAKPGLKSEPKVEAKPEPKSESKTESKPEKSD